MSRRPLARSSPQAHKARHICPGHRGSGVGITCLGVVLCIRVFPGEQGCRLIRGELRFSRRSVSLLRKRARTAAQPAGQPAQEPTCPPAAAAGRQLAGGASAMAEPTDVTKLELPPGCREWLKGRSREETVLEPRAGQSPPAWRPGPGHRPRWHRRHFRASLDLPSRPALHGPCRWESLTTRGGWPAFTYRRYCQLLARWADEESRALQRQVCPDEIERWLFGQLAR